MTPRYSQSCMISSIITASLQLEIWRYVQNHAQMRLAEVADQQVQKLAASTTYVLRMTEADLMEAVEVYRCILYPQHACVAVVFGLLECVWPGYPSLPL